MPPGLTPSLLACLAAVGFAGCPAPASQPEPPPAVSLSASPSLTQLIDLCAQQFAVDIEYNAADGPLGSKLTLRSAGAPHGPVNDTCTSTTEGP